MDVTKRVLEVSPSAERMMRMLHRHYAAVVICRRDAGLQQACHSVHGNSRDLVHPNGISESNRGNSKESLTTVTKVARNEYSFNSLASKHWTKAETLSVKKLFKEKGIAISSVKRKSDLQVRPVGKINPMYTGTLVAAQVYNSNSCKTVLVVAKLNLFQPALEAMYKEISEFLIRNCSNSEEIYILSKSSINQWKLEKVR